MPRTAHLVHTRLNYLFRSGGRGRWMARRVGLYLTYTVPPVMMLNRR